MNGTQMNYLSVCSGIEAATVAWHHMGWKPVGFSEIEKFPSQVLAHHYPDVTNFGDMTKYKEWQIDGTVGLLVGGTPCQSFSVAGLRKGLEDPRGNLALTYCGILDHFRPKWFVWENVPGVLSSNGGRDFGSFLGALVELGYGFSYRVLDSQYFGVAQRRRRVFVVGHLGDWRPTAEILFESDCLRRDIAKGKRKKQENSRNFIPSVANTLQTTCNDYSRADGFNMIAYEWHNQDSRIKPVNVAATLNCNAGGREGHLIQKVYENHPSDSRVKEMGEVCQTVTSTWGMGGGNIPFVQSVDIYNLTTNENVSQTIRNGTDIDHVGGLIQNMAVRRLTEVECERLQGFPDNYTNIKENCPSGARYKALGNSMAVPVMRWIGERINNYERL
jgi:DNA (cytosine-5)-methyltransferase 1